MGLKDAYGPPLILAGTANPQLVDKIVEHVGVDLCKMDVNLFADGEFNIQIKESVRDRDVFVVQPTCTPVNDNLMQLFIIIDALHRASARRVNAVIPYFGYSRQEKKLHARDPISAKLVANFLETAGTNRVIAVDVHAEATQGFFDIPFDHLTAVKSLAEHCKKHYPHNEVMVVSPDVGGTRKARKLAHLLGAPMAIVDKSRPQADSIEIMNVIGDVKGKECIVIDDLISTGSTLIGGSKALLERGAKSVSVLATHGVFSNNGLRKLVDSDISQICVTDTIPVPEDVNTKGKLKVVSVAPLIADAIIRINEGRSVSELFD